MRQSEYKKLAEGLMSNSDFKVIDGEHTRYIDMCRVCTEPLCRSRDTSVCIRGLAKGLKKLMEQSN